MVSSVCYLERIQQGIHLTEVLFLRVGMLKIT